MTFRRRFSVINTCWAVLAALLPAVYATVVQAAPAEVRGTWLTTTGPNHIIWGDKTADVMADLREIGLNTVYVETWKNGYTNFPSPTLANLTGGPDRAPVYLGTTRDLVEETLIHAHRNQLNYVGWFEYGFSPQYLGGGNGVSTPLGTYMKNQGWLLQDQNGNYSNSTYQFGWMNPAVPEVRQFLIDITLELVNNYDVDGIQFDDRLAWPVDFGFDDTTIGLYTQQTGNSAPTDKNDSAFRSWREAQVTLFAAELYQAVKQARPELQVSVSPSVFPFSLNNYHADWPDWEQQELFDEFVPQVYRSNLSDYLRDVGGQVAPFQPDDLEKLILGLRVNGGASTPYADLQQMIEHARAVGAAGHSLWYSRGVRDEYANQLTAFYDVAGQGHAPSPIFGADHRPAPLIATSLLGGTDDWEVDVDQPGRYRVVAKIGSLWQEVESLLFGDHVYQLHVPGATEVELLVDRRNFEVVPGDFDGNGLVDGGDLDRWYLDFGATLSANADGDNDGDSDGADFFAWQRQHAGGVAAVTNSLAIPEPSAQLLLMFWLLLGGTRRVR